MMRFTTVLSSLCLFLLPVSAHAGDCMERDWDDACYDEPSDTMLLEIDARRVSERLGVEVVAAVATVAPTHAQLAVAVRGERGHRWVLSYSDVEVPPAEASGDDVLDGLDASTSSAAAAASCELDGGSDEACGMGGEPSGEPLGADEARYEPGIAGLIRRASVLLGMGAPCEEQIIEVCINVGFSYSVATGEQYECTVDECDWYAATVCDGMPVGDLEYFGPGMSRNLECEQVK